MAINYRSDETMEKLVSSLRKTVEPKVFNQDLMSMTDFKDGQVFSAVIENVLVEGKIAIDPDGSVYLCQDHMSNMKYPPILHGFKHTYKLDSLINDNVKDLKVTQYTRLNKTQKELTEKTSITDSSLKEESTVVFAPDTSL